MKSGRFGVLRGAIEPSQRALSNDVLHRFSSEGNGGDLMGKLLFVKCHRCRGVMTYNTFYGFQGQFRGLEMCDLRGDC